VAQLVSRGTLTRNRWDFFESGDAFANITAVTVATGTRLLFLTNNVPQVQFDIYRVDFACASATSGVAIQVLQPNTPLVDQGGGVHSQAYLQVDQGTPAGQIGIALSPVELINYYLYYRPDALTAFSFELYAGPLVSLPPNFAIAVNVTSTPNLLCGVTFWYQQVLDLLPPAP
jgi:hypothetical protein